MTSLELFEELFKRIGAERWKSFETSDGRLKIFQFGHDYKNFSIAFSIECGEMMWQDIEVWDDFFA